jgi:hypothetical protein
MAWQRGRDHDGLLEGFDVRRISRPTVIIDARVHETLNGRGVYVGVSTYSLADAVQELDRAHAAGDVASYNEILADIKDYVNELGPIDFSGQVSVEFQP